MYIQIRLNLTKIIEGIKSKQNIILIKKNLQTIPLLNILLILGYISGFEIFNYNFVKVFLKYTLFGDVFSLVLTKKKFVTNKQLLLLNKFNPRVIYIILTPQGISYTKECLLKKINGFLLAEVY